MCLCQTKTKFTAVEEGLICVACGANATCSNGVCVPLATGGGTGGGGCVARSYTRTGLTASSLRHDAPVIAPDGALAAGGGAASVSLIGVVPQRSQALRFTGFVATTDTVTLVVRGTVTTGPFQPQPPELFIRWNRGNGWEQGVFFNGEAQLPTSPNGLTLELVLQSRSEEVTNVSIDEVFLRSSAGQVSRADDGVVRPVN